MAGPLQAAGAAPEPTEYAPLTMDRYITGLWTQRSPLRDADVPYLYGKFYSATRFDSIIDGINREVTSRLTLARRPGTTIYNSNIFPPIQSFYSFKYLQNGVQQVRVMADTASIVYDATAGGQINVWNKTAGAGKTRFLGVGNELFFGNGVDQKKLLTSNKTWAANTTFNVGDFIIDSNGNIQLINVVSGLTANIADVQVIRKAPIGSGGPLTSILIFTLTAPAPAWPQGSFVTFGGLTARADLNGSTQQFVSNILNIAYNLGLAPNQVAFSGGTMVAYPTTPDTGTLTGTISSGALISGGAMPAWASSLGSTTADGAIIWTCFGSPVQNWQLTAPMAPPTLAPAANNRYWQPRAPFPVNYSVLDSNGNVQTVLANPGPGANTGQTQPTWKAALGAYTFDGGLQWINNGPILSWSANSTVPYMTCAVDSNGNLQIAEQVVAPGASGATPPSWGTALGSTTTDNNITWTNVGPGTELRTATVEYAYALVGIDKSISNASPVATIPNGVLGPDGAYQIQVTGGTTADPQCSQIWIYRVAQGGAILLFLAAIPNPSPGTVTTWTYTDLLPDSALNPEIQAPIDDQGDPPPLGFTGPIYHNQRTWGFVGDTVYYSEGPDAIPTTANGNTAFPPLNSFVFPETITKLRAVTITNGGVIVYGTANIYVILGNGTAANPYYTQIYMATVGLLNYDAEDIVGSTAYLFTNNNKVVSLDPSAGYTEVGFPIGDQFNLVTTGGISAALYDPANTYVTWHEKTSGDSGVYIADGTVGWFRYSPVATPESGYLWSPRAALFGGTSAVQSVETATGVRNMLIGPSATAGSGPIVMRDITVFSDNFTSYAESYVTIGNIVLCESGEVAEVAHVALISMLVGDRPSVGMLYGEIAETANIFFDTLEYTSVDPPNLEESETLYSDRYTTLQDGVCPKCDHCQIKISWPRQEVADELLSHTIYGAKYSERRETPG